MPLPRVMSAFPVEHRVWNAAVKHHGCKYTLPNKPAAVKFRQRCYHLRLLYRERLIKENLGIPGYEPVTPWDEFEIVLPKESPHVVVFKFKTGEGELTTMDGEAIDQNRPLASDDLLFNEAADLIARYGE